MVTMVDDLPIPPSLASNEWLQNMDVTRRAASGQLVRKVSPRQYWQVTINYAKKTLPYEFRVALYKKITLMRVKPMTIKFVPHDGTTEISAVCLCTKPLPPTAAKWNLDPTLAVYTTLGASFEEVCT